MPKTILESRAEEQRIVYVTDRPAERGITLNNIISGMILLVAGWAGSNIDDIKDKVGLLDKKASLNAEAIINIVDQQRQNSASIKSLEIGFIKTHPKHNL